MSGSAAFEVDGLTKRYGGREVLRIDRLVVPRGKIFGVMGPSGAGKSTLLRLLDLLEPATSGSVRFMGERAEGERRRLSMRRRMAMVFQRPALFNASVYDNVAYGLRVRGIGGSRARQRVVAALEAVGLAGLADRSARSLSGGEAQRIALARAMVVEPEALLLDEPTANLDPGNVALMEKLIHALNGEQGATIVIVTHNVFQARRLADEVLFLYQGRPVETGPARDVFSSPRDERTRAFIEGKMVY